jgi:predicted small lipoprotein YifL
MDKRIATLLVGLCLAAVPACGRKGPLVLPASRAPLPVAGLTAVAGDGTAVLRWVNPVKSVSGKPLGPLAAVEIWVFDKPLPAGGRPLTSEAVEKSARLARKIPRGEFAAHGGGAGEAAGVMAYTYDLPAGAAVPVKLAFTVRVVDRKGRVSEFPAPAAVEISRRTPGVDRPAAPGVC